MPEIGQSPEKASQNIQPGKHSLARLEMSLVEKLGRGAQDGGLGGETLCSIYKVN